MILSAQSTKTGCNTYSFINECASSSIGSISSSKGEFSVGVVNSSQRHSEAMHLVQRRYEWRGYETDLLAARVANRRQIVLEASKQGLFIGTLTLGFDSKERGLLAEKLYAKEVVKLREAGRFLTEITKLAIDPEYGSKEVLAALFHLAYIYGRVGYNATDVLIEVNPRHAAYYMRKLGFKQLADVRMCERVNAPAILLHLEASYAGSRDLGVRSLYPYFLSRTEVDTIVDRLALAA
jgi:hypothetical protein